MIVVRHLCQRDVKSKGVGQCSGVTYTLTSNTIVTYLMLVHILIDSTSLDFHYGGLVQVGFSPTDSLISRMPYDTFMIKFRLTTI